MRKSSKKVSVPFLDVAILIFLFLFVVLFAIRYVDFSIAPFEDAAMLMRYAQHFAQGHGIVWNIGEKPVDGATDFLFMILLGVFVKIGMTLKFATRFIGFSSHVLTVWIIYLTLRKLFRARLLPALVTSLCLAVGPGLYYTAACFGTPFFALFVCITWYAALTMIFSVEIRRGPLIFAISSLIMSLIRPEGVILSGLMLVSVIYIKGLKKSRRAIFYYLGIMLFLGGFYFLWRWRYFGFPLPNPFYAKGRGHIYLGSLEGSIQSTIRLCLPFLSAFIIGFYSRKTLRLSVGFLIPIVGFMSAFVLISDEMNFGSRFQYALLPLALMSWWPLTEAIKKDCRFPSWKELNLQKRVTLILLAMALSIGLMGYQYKTGRSTYCRDGRYDVAVMLSDYREKNFTVATTEAGLLPLYSHWKALDAWGLNDQWIARNGGITEEYLCLFRPHLIIFYDYYSPVVSRGVQTGKLFEIVTTLRGYAEKNRYVLAAVFGDSPYQAHYYYVRPDFPESSEIISRIRSTKYYWWRSGKECVNYALLSREDKRVK